MECAPHLLSFITKAGLTLMYTNALERSKGNQKWEQYGAHPICNYLWVIILSSNNGKNILQIKNFERKKISDRRLVIHIDAT